MRRWTLAGAVLCALVLLTFKILPWVRSDRATVASSPSLSGLATVSRVPLKPGATACVTPVPILTTTRVVLVLINAPAGAPQRLRITLRGSGYRAKGIVAANYQTGGDSPASARVGPAPPRNISGTVCTENIGRRRVAIIGTDDPRDQVPAQSTVDGNPVSDLALMLYGPTEPIASHIGELTRRGGAMQGLPDWLSQLVAYLFLFGVPIAAVAAITIAVRREP